MNQNLSMILSCFLLISLALSLYSGTVSSATSSNSADSCQLELYDSTANGQRELELYGGKIAPDLREAMSQSGGAQLSVIVQTVGATESQLDSFLQAKHATVVSRLPQLGTFEVKLSAQSLREFAQSDLVQY